MLSKNLHSFLRLLKNKGLKEEIVTKIGLYELVKSTTLESNKSLAWWSVTFLSSTWREVRRTFPRARMVRIKGRYGPTLAASTWPRSSRLTLLVRWREAAR